MKSRIASLLPSSTEIVFALGQGHRLVARSHECDFPAEVRALPSVTSAKLLAERSSLQIDDDVKALLRQALAVYDVDADALDAQTPDLIITQTQCEVCAVSLRDVESAVRRMLRSAPKILALEPRTLEDVFTDMRRVADAIGVPDKGRALELALRHRMQSVSIREAAQRGLAARPTVACVEWIEPLMAAGNWVPTLVQLAGGTNVLGEAGAHSPFIQLEELVRADPDLVVVMPCGFDIERIKREMPVVDALPAWRELRAVREGRVYLADGNQFFNRPGPRIVESLEILVEILHESNDGFPLGHEGSGWERWTAAGSGKVTRVSDRESPRSGMALESIKVSAVIPASPEAIYDAWLDEARHTAFTGGEATVDPSVGGRHSAWDGYIVGETLELEPGRRIVQSWRSLDFPEGAQPSRLEVTLTPVAGGAEVTILHTDIPDGQGAEYEEGWIAHYLQPLVAYFSPATELATAPATKKPPATTAKKKKKAPAKKAPTKNAAPKAKKKATPAKKTKKPVAKKAAAPHKKTAKKSARRTRARS